MHTVCKGNQSSCTRNSSGPPKNLYRDCTDEITWIKPRAKTSSRDSNLFCLICYCLQHLDSSHTFVPTSQDRAPGIFSAAHLFVCPSVQFCTFLFGQNDRGHNDPAMIPPAPHSWNIADLHKVNKRLPLQSYIPQSRPNMYLIEK